MYLAAWSGRWCWIGRRAAVVVEDAGDVEARRRLWPDREQSCSGVTLDARRVADADANHIVARPVRVAESEQRHVDLLDPRTWQRHTVERDSRSERERVRPRIVGKGVLWRFAGLKAGHHRMLRPALQ